MAENGKKRKEKRRLLWLLPVLMGAAMLCFLTGCRKQGEDAGNEKENLAMDREELMLIVATERNRYEQIYTDQIWSAQVSADGTSFQEYLLDQIRLFSEDLLVIGAMADHYGIALDNSEKEQIRRLAQDYYGRLSPGDKTYTGAGEEDVLNLYQRYCLASKTVTELTKDADLEISDNEAKVIEIQQIVMDDEGQAWEVLAQVQQEGADFTAIAKANSLDEEIQLKLGRGKAGEAVENEAFSLASGEISAVIQEGGRFYIIKCLNDYDQEATLKRKEELSLLRKDKAFRGIYDQFLEQHPVTISDQVWQDIRCETGEDTTTTNFFELYKEYFPG